MWSCVGVAKEPAPPLPAQRSKERLGSRSSRVSRGEEPDGEGDGDKPQPTRKPSATTPPPATEEAPPKKEATRLLDELFRKTKTTPCIYWLPLTEEEVSAGDSL